MIECRNRSENLINQKNTKFYIEAVPPNSFQLPKIIFFEVEEKNIAKNGGHHFFLEDFLINQPLVYKEIL